jgi:FMN-dependent NADH-azoreductase
MFKILVLNSSVSGALSVSDQLVEAAVKQLVRTHPEAQVVRRDLARDPLPHLTPATVQGVRSTPATPAEHAAHELANTLVAELQSASVVVIGAPMYNFSVPTTLRAWFDHVVRPGVTFTYAGGTPKGLVDDKPVIVIESRGGLYSEGPAMSIDFQEPYVRHLLGFIGLTDVRFVRAEKIGYGPEARAASIEAAIAAIGQAVQPATLAA